MPPRTVRIVGDPEPWQVIGRTPTSMILVNPAARQRRDLHVLEAQLRVLRATIAAHEAAVVDVSGHASEGP